ncbi:MAG: hypothetical protein HKN68_09295 [Saprospiraceae bacterium]|nr:hypothetical protein [Saprospiraceae bacterium]
MRWITIYIIFLILVSCNGDSNNSQDPMIASAGNRNLFLSDIKELIPEGSSIEDSTLIANQFIDGWIRKSILLKEAASSLGPQIDIDKLVRDYRESLLIYNYEKKLVEEQLDTIVTKEQKEAFYNQNRETYKVVNPILKGSYIIIPSNFRGLTGFKRNWIRQNKDEIYDFATNNNLTASLNDSIWVTFESFKNQLPEDIFTDDQFRSENPIDKVNDGNQYFVKVEEFLDIGEIAPLDYIEDKVEKVILYNRKIKLLKNIKEQLYQKELQLNRIKINR